MSARILSPPLGSIVSSYETVRRWPSSESRMRGVRPLRVSSFSLASNSIAMVTFMGCTFLFASATLRRNGSSASVGPGGFTDSTCAEAAAASWCAPASLTPPNAAPAARMAGSTMPRNPGPPARAGAACLSLLSLMASPRRRSLLDLHQVLQHLVGGRDRLRARLEGALVRDEVHELRRDVHVGLLERAGDERPASAGARGAERRVARLLAGGPEVVARLGEAVVRRELRDGQLADRDRLPVGVDAAHRSVLADLD